MEQGSKNERERVKGQSLLNPEKNPAKKKSAKKREKTRKRMRPESKERNKPYILKQFPSKAQVR